METFLKDASPLNMMLFQPPNPPNYSPDELKQSLYWIPRNSDSAKIPTLIFPYPSEYSEETYRTGTKAGAEAHRMIIYSHGNADDLGLLHDLLGEFCIEWKAHVVAYDYSGYGWSGRHANETNINEDSRAVYDYVTGTMGWPSERIIFFGHSIGTGPTAALVGALEREDVNVGGMVLLSPYSSINAVVKNFVKQGAKSNLLGNITSSMFIDMWVSKKEMKDIKNTPVLLIHGEKDTLIPATESKILYDECSCDQKTLHLCPEADHDEFDYDNDVIAPTKRFIEKSLAPCMVDEWVISETTKDWVPNQEVKPPELILKKEDKDIPDYVGAMVLKKGKTPGKESNGAEQAGHVIKNWFDGLGRLSSMASKVSTARAKKDFAKGKAFFKNDNL